MDPGAAEDDRYSRYGAGTGFGSALFDARNGFNELNRYLHWFHLCMQNAWQYVQRVVADTTQFFSPLEEVIRTHFLPALLGVPLVEIDGDNRQLLTHSIKLGGLAIRNPVDTAPRVHKASLTATYHLTVSLVDPATRFDPGAHCMCATEAGAAA